MTQLNEEVKRALETVRAGGVILYPTDTVWGLGCDATNAEAVKKLFEIKRRPEAKSMIVLVDSEAALERTVEDVPEVAWQLIEVADKPLTIIYDHPRGVAPRLIADDGSLGVRITKEEFSSELCRRMRRPLVSTSANFSGQPTPRSFAEIPEELKEAVDYVVDFRRNETELPAPSGIIKLSASGLVKVIR